MANSTDQKHVAMFKECVAAMQGAPEGKYKESDLNFIFTPGEKSLLARLTKYGDKMFISPAQGAVIEKIHAKL